MKPIISQVVVVLASASFLGGCATWQMAKKVAGYEIAETGGAAGHYESYVLPAKSPQMVVLRQATIFTMLSEMDARNIKSNLDKEYFIRISRKLNREIAAEYVKTTVACKGAATALASGCKEAIEANTPVIEADLLSMARFAVEPDKFKKLVSDVETANTIGSFKDASGIMLDVLVDLHEGAASVRSAIHLTQDFKDGMDRPYEVAYAAYVKDKDGFSKTAVDHSVIDAMFNISWNICSSVAQDLPAQSISNLNKIVFQDANTTLQYCVFKSSDGVSFLPPAAVASLAPEDKQLAPAGAAPVVAAAAAPAGPAVAVAAAGGH